MSTIAPEKNSAIMEVQAEVKALHAELETLKMEFSARISAMEALLPANAEAAEEQIPAETLAMIAAAVTAFLGKKVRIRAAQLIPAVNTWGQTGRAIIQASHNLQR
jgi:hypothetical protein